jgi:hypothetical protein
VSAGAFVVFDSLPPPQEAKNNTVAIAGTKNNLFMSFFLGLFENAKLRLLNL